MKNVSKERQVCIYVLLTNDAHSPLGPIAFLKKNVGGGATVLITSVLDYKVSVDPLPVCFLACLIFRLTSCVTGVDCTEVSIWSPFLISIFADLVSTSICGG